MPSTQNGGTLPSTDSLSVSATMLRDLAMPFHADDIEWRVSRSGRNNKGVYAFCLAYLTSRSIQQRLDEVVGPGNWRNEMPSAQEWGKTVSVVCGISVRVDGEWITKWDVAEPTNIEPAKGGFSGAMKRAGAQWGIGRYLYHLDETFAETREDMPGSRDEASKWTYAKLSDKQGGGAYWWKPPALPAWALPKEPEHEVSKAELARLKDAWKAKFVTDKLSVKATHEAFVQFVVSVCGEFPASDPACWTKDAYAKCEKRIAETVDPAGVSSDVPFEGAN